MFSCFRPKVHAPVSQGKGRYCTRAINFGRQCHFKILLDCHKLKKKSLPDYAHVNKVSKK
jgi:hypothetical protein